MSQFTFPFSNFWGMVVTSSQSPQSSWYENWPPVMVSYQQVTSFPLTGHTEVASCSTVHITSFKVFLPLRMLPMAAWGHLSDPAPWGTVMWSLTHFCCTELQAGREDGLAKHGAISPSLMALSHTLPFLRPHVYIQGSEQMNPGPIPPWGALRLRGVQPG